MIIPSPFTDDVYAIADHVGVPAGELQPAPVQGQVNLTVFMGADLVLRIPRTPTAAEQLAIEAAVIPLVQAAGVPTSTLISYDPTRQIASVPYVILERLHGPTLAELNVTDAGPAHESLGEILVALHRIRRSKVGAVDAIPEPYTFSPSEVVQRLREAGEIGTAQSGWLLEQFERLNPDGPALADPVLIHRDVIPSNVIVDRRGRAIALLDWGCAEWGNPARDLVGLPLSALPALVSGYRAAADSSTSAGHHNADDLALERDALWFHLYLALARLLKEPSTSEDRNWAAPRQATLLDILAFVSAAVPVPWPELVRRPTR